MAQVNQIWLVSARVKYGQPWNNEFANESKASVRGVLERAGLTPEKQDEVLMHMNRPDRWEEGRYFFSDNDGTVVSTLRLPLAVFNDIINKIAAA